LWITFRNEGKIILICDEEILILNREFRTAVQIVVDNQAGSRIKNLFLEASYIE